MDRSEKSIRLLIDGMTCVNCQNRILEELNQTEGIIHARVSYGKGTADIIYDESKVMPNEIKAVIEKLGYKISSGNRRPEADMGRTVGMLIIIIALSLMLQSAGLLNLLAPSRLADTGMGYGMLFIIGILTSVHCIAMCGGINLSQCLPKGIKKIGEKEGRFEVLLPALFYNLGRVLSYTAMGFVLGLTGFLIGGKEYTGLSLWLQGILKIAAGLCMLLMGIRMLGIFP